MQDKRSERFNVYYAKFVPVDGPEKQSNPNQQIKKASSVVTAKFHRRNRKRELRLNISKTLKVTQAHEYIVIFTKQGCRLTENCPLLCWDH